MRRALLLVIALAACADDGDAKPDPATCPEAPFEVCGVIDGGCELTCRDGVVYEQDLTATAFCAPDSHEEACRRGPVAAHAVHSCASATCSGLSRYSENYADCPLYDPESICTPPP